MLQNPNNVRNCEECNSLRCSSLSNLSKKTKKNARSNPTHLVVVTQWGCDLITHLSFIIVVLILFWFTTRKGLQALMSIYMLNILAPVSLRPSLLWLVRSHTPDPAPPTTTVNHSTTVTYQTSRWAWIMTMCYMGMYCDVIKSQN